MQVFAVIDIYSDLHVALFASRESAESFIASKDEDDAYYLDIVAWEVQP